MKRFKWKLHNKTLIKNKKPKCHTQKEAKGKDRQKDLALANVSRVVYC